MRRYLASGLLLGAGVLGVPAALAGPVPSPAPAPGLTPTCLADLDLNLLGGVFRLRLGADPYLGQRLRDLELRDRFDRLRDLELRGRFGVSPYFDSYLRFRALDPCGRYGYPAPRYGSPYPYFGR
jgi:hypothetical protein